MRGDIYINNYDAFERWGVNMEDGALSSLMTPPALKEFVNNESRLTHGAEYIVTEPRFQARELTLPFHIVARDRSDFLAKYGRFCEEVLEVGEFTLKTRYSKDVYHLIYSSCNQFRQFEQQIAVFSLKVIEPNPKNRR